MPAVRALTVLHTKTSSRPHPLEKTWVKKVNRFPNVGLFGPFHQLGAHHTSPSMGARVQSIAPHFFSHGTDFTFQSRTDFGKVAGSVF